MKVVLPLPAMPTQTMATGEADELGEGPGPAAAVEADMVAVEGVRSVSVAWARERRSLRLPF